VDKNVKSLFLTGSFCFVHDAYTLAENSRMTNEQSGALSSIVTEMKTDMEDIKMVESYKVSSNLMNFIQNAQRRGCAECEGQTKLLDI
jgi:hypothetical protein